MRPAFLSAALDLVLPPRCMGCGLIVPADGSFCPDCWASLAFITPPTCALCGDPFEVPRESGSLCGACLAEPPRFNARAVVAYGGAAKDVILGLKHSDRDHLARAMGAQIARLGSDWLVGALIVPVPLHRSRLWRRGYNQAALIARAVARASGADLALDLLERRKATPPSQGMNRTERAANVRGAFRVPQGKREKLRGRAVVLIDDVLTTGATADACARTLRRAGAATVNLLAWARVVR
jgi:ComF family protein